MFWTCTLLAASCFVSLAGQTPLPAQVDAAAAPEVASDGDTIERLFPQGDLFGDGTPRLVVRSSNPRRKTLVANLGRKMDAIKPAEGTRRSLDDYFVVGTAQLDRVTRGADVRFEVRQGRQQVAEYLVDFVLGASSSQVRKWHVFSRHADPELARQTIALARYRFDQSLAYQAELRRIYAARAMCRT